MKTALVINRNCYVNSQAEVRRQINLANHELNPSDGNLHRGGFYSEGWRGAGEGGWGLKFHCALHTLNPSLLSFPFHLYGG